MTIARGCLRVVAGLAPRVRPLALIAAVVMTPLAAPAQNGGAGDKLPRFVSLRSDEVNLRVGPGETYPIEWVLKRKGMPLEVIREFQNWRMVRDWQDTRGWILDRMLTDKRTVMIDGGIRALYRRPDPSSEIVARAQPGVVARLLECGAEWCRIEAAGFKGWVRRGEVWGVLPGETVQ